MLTKEAVLRSLFDKLATVYPMPAKKDGWAEMVAANCPDGVTEEQLEELATRIIEERKQKTFPLVQELITLVKSLKAGKSLGPPEGLDANGRQTYRGDDFEATFVESDDPIWKPLADKWVKLVGKGKTWSPAATTSKYAAGTGTWFRTEWINEFARNGMNVKKPVWQENPAVKERIINGFAEFREEIARRVPQRKTEAQKQAEAVASFKARCEKLGIDPDSIKDAPSTWEKLNWKPAP